MLILRDDDIQVETDLKRFKEIHNLFIKYNVLHTISLICENIEQNKPLVKYLQQQVKLKNCDIQVHAWEHYDFTTNLEKLNEDLPKCVEIITRLFGKKPDTLFPPWNRSSKDVEYIAWRNDLKVSNQKISLSQYLRGVKGDVVNMHYWSPECEQLEEALISHRGHCLTHNEELLKMCEL